MPPKTKADTPAVPRDPITHKTGRTRAFGITTDTPVSAYAIFPYGGAASRAPRTAPK